MCIAIVKPEGATITDEQLTNCFENNSDGAGIAFAQDNKLYLIKGIFKKDEFINKVRQVETIAQGAMLIHCRISTSGLIDKLNCHPHVINENLVMAHNGILDIDVPKESEVSDTVIFIYEYLRNLPEDFIKNEGIMKLIEAVIGNHNKFCFLNNKGEYAIANEKQGEWFKGIWYSNDTYEYTYRPLYANYNGYFRDNDTFDKKPTFSKNYIKKIKKKITHLSDYKMYELGQYPMYNIDTKQFIEYDELHYGSNAMFLDEISDELQEFWEYEYETRFGTLKKAG